jgi:phosphoribosylamine---glycine ligase
MAKKILLLGHGGREHALAKAFSRSPQKPELFGVLGAKNPGIISLCKDFELCTEKNFGEENGFSALKAFAQRNQIDFAFLGPDDPIGSGAVDALLEIGIQSIAPLKSLARLESSKGFTRSLLEKYQISGNPIFRVFTNEEGMEEFCASLGAFVVKDDGLCGGKGVLVQGDHFQTKAEGLVHAKNMLAKRGQVVMEEKLQGPEFSLMFFTDGKSIVPMPQVADHKRAFEGDKGPNTGGMGTISFPNGLPFVSKENAIEAEEMTKKVMVALEQECGKRFHGIMYGGFMRTKNGTKLIEYNARFGDPESLNVLPLLETDFVELCEAIIAERLSEVEVRFAKKATVCKYIVPEGYPESPKKGVEIQFDASKIPKGVEVFMASVYEENGKLFLGGSRAIGFVGIADTIEEAETLAEQATKSVVGEVFHRKDIGTRELIEKRMEDF